MIRDLMIFHSMLCGGLFVAMFLGLVNPVSAVGVAIRPERLRLTTPWGQAASGEILVSNPSDLPARYALHTAGNAAPRIEPAEFRLDPGSSQLVRINVHPRGPFRQRLQLEVVARPLGTTGLGLASGVRYSVELTPALPWVSFLIRGVLLLSLGAGTWFVWRRRFRRMRTTYAT